MGASFLITLREGVEAALVIGIVLGVLSRLGQPRLKRFVWLGTLSAVGLSSIAGIGIYLMGISFSGAAEQIFEGTTMIFAAGLLTWMIFWMKTHGRKLARELEKETREAVLLGGKALFAVAFIAVLREGLETALFLVAATFQTGALGVLGGGVIGLGVAVLIGVLIFKTGQKLNISLFFNATGLLLLFVAAGLVAHGVHEFQEAGVIPVFIEHVWDTNGILDERGIVGSFLTALFGYNGNPSLLEVLSYATYLLAVGLAARPQAASVQEVSA